MKIVNLVCPNCGATMQIDVDNRNLTCNYCGGSLYLDDEVQLVKSRIEELKQYGIKFYLDESINDELRCINMHAEFLQGYKYSRPIRMIELERFFKAG